MEYKIVSEENHNEVWGVYDDKDRAQKRIDEGYHQRFMYEKDRDKKLIVIDSPPCPVRRNNYRK